jgi:hypothetical protein
MQTQRLSHLAFPLTPSTGAPGNTPNAPNPAKAPANTAQPGGAKADSASAQSERRKSAQELAARPGVVYTPAERAKPDTPAELPTNLANMPFDKLIDLGHSKGVFTKITYNRSGVMDGKAAGQASGDFVKGAVEVMRDLEEGMAALRGTDATQTAQASHFWSDGLRGIKQVASKLNVFA